MLPEQSGGISFMQFLHNARRSPRPTGRSAFQPENIQEMSTPQRFVNAIAKVDEVAHSLR